MPKRGAKCAFAGADEGEMTAPEEGDFRAATKVVRDVRAGLEDEGGSKGCRERSQMVIRARPCATLALRATVQAVEASRSLSREARRDGCAWAVST